MNEHTYFRPVSGRMLQQSILKHVRRRPDGVEEGAAIGNDAAIFLNKGIKSVQTTGSAVTERFPEGASVTAAEAAWITAENQLATADAVPGVVQVLLTMGSGCPEERIRKEMQILTRLSAERKCPIVGGNTTTFGDGDDCLIQLVMTGVLEEAARADSGSGEAADEGSAGGNVGGNVGGNAGKELPARRRPAPTDVVYFLGETGCLGAELLAAGRKEALAEHFSESYLREMRYPAEAFSIVAAAGAARRAGAVFLHDVSNGGVYAALYQLAEAADGGILVQHEGLTIRQSVIELCECLGINPYLLYGTGGLLAVVPEEQAEAWEAEMSRTDHRFRRAAVITKEKARMVQAESFPMRRALNLPEGDAFEEA